MPCAVMLCSRTERAVGVIRFVSCSERVVVTWVHFVESSIKSAVPMPEIKASECVYICMRASSEHVLKTVRNC